ncbi:(-)-germacrene D synthase-like protein [Drosera capensis]
MYALQRPIRKSLPRPGARRYILMYEEQDSHDDTLLKFAKLDYNILQKMHQKELSIISRWWNNLGVKRNLPWARDRIVELYIWILDLFPSQYASGRKFLAKVIALTSIIDDFYDTYGTPEEHVRFTEAVERWEISAIEKVPNFMRLCYQTLLDVYGEMEEEIAKEGNAYRIGYAKEAMKTLVRAYFEESKWINSDELPTYEEYMKIALVTCGYPMLIISSLVGMGDGVTKEDFDWLLGGPKIVEAASIITRLMDDMVENKRQLEEQGVREPSAVDCYTYQYGVSEQQAHQVLNKFVLDAWKDINEAYMRPSPASKSVLNVALNLSRFMDEIYKDKDGYDDSTGKLKDYVTELLIDPVEI